MSFDPSLPEEGHNVSKTHPLREAAVLVAGVFFVGAAFVVIVGAAADSIVSRLPPSAESWIFQWFVPDDPAWGAEPDARASAVQAMVDRLAEGTPGLPYRFRASVWNEPQPNALAFPGGRIVVTSGLLDAAQSENELVFVLGHELGHYQHRDHLRGIGRGLAMGLVALAAGTGGGAGRFIALSAELAGRSYDREQERDADRTGLELLYREYGHVGGAAEFFERLPDPDGLQGGRIASYLATHPLHEDRIEAVNDVARERGWSQDDALQPLPYSRASTESGAADDGRGSSPAR